MLTLLVLCVLADAGYGIDYDFRQHLSDMGLLYVVGITSAQFMTPEFSAVFIPIQAGMTV